MYPIWIKDGKNKEPQDFPVYYILAQNGFFISKRMPFWRAVVPVETISILEPENPSVELFLPPIPEPLTRDIVRFFAWVYGRYYTEAMITLHYNDEKRGYRIYVPKQKVSGNHIDYDTPENMPDEVLIGTLHSHCDMSAFHSEVDRHDEKSFDGIHGVFGGFSTFEGKQDFELSLQAVVNGSSFPLKQEKCMLGIKRATGGTEDKKTKSPWFLFYKNQRNRQMFTLLGESRLLPKTYAPPKEWEENLTVASWPNHFAVHKDPVSQMQKTKSVYPNSKVEEKRESVK